MKKFSVILALLLVVGFSGAVMAFPPDIPPLEFNVHVAEWATVEVTNPPLLEVRDGSASGTISAVAKVVTNSPWKISVSTTRVAEDKEINNWFYYDFYIGDKHIGGGNPGAGQGGYGTLNPGVHDVKIDLTVKSTHTLGGFPRPQEWYTLIAGDYKTITTLTIEAAK